MTNFANGDRKQGLPIPFDEAAGRTTGALSTIEMLVLSRNTDAEVRRLGQGRHRVLRIRFYGRYSTADQKVVSIHRQVAFCLRYIRSMGLGKDYELHVDMGVSAKQAFTRDGLQALLRDCDAGLVDIVVVEYFDRWSREVYDAAEICERLEKSNVEFHCATHGRRLDKEEIIQSAIRAERDRVRRSALCWSGRMQSAMAGGWPARLPFGYRPSSKRGWPEICDVNAETVRLIFVLAADGISPRSIVRHLIAENRIGPSGSVSWSVSTVNDILARPIYAGLVMYGRQEHQGDRLSKSRKRRDRPVSEIARSRNEAYRIVPDELFEKVQRRRNGPAGHRGPHVVNLLTDRVSCDCKRGQDHRFVVAPTRVSCGRQISDGGCPCKPWSMPRREVEAAVVRAVGERLRAYVDEDDFTAAFARNFKGASEKRKAERKRSEARLKSLEGELERLLHRSIRKSFKPAQLESMASSLREEELKLTARLGELRELDAAQADVGMALTSLGSALEGIEMRLPFKPSTLEDEVFVQAMRRVVKRIEWRRKGVPDSHVRLAIHVDFGAHVLGGDAPGTTVEVILVELEVLRSPVRQTSLRAAAKRLTSDGSHRLTDAQWDAVASRLPDPNSMRKAAQRVETRDVVDALMLNLRTGIKIVSKNPIHPRHMGDAIRRFVYAGGDRLLLEGLGRIDPGLVAGLDLRAVEMADSFIQVPPERRRSHLRERAHGLDGSTALTDEQWRLSEHLIGPGIEVSRGGRSGLPPRMLIEAALLMFRSRCFWSDLPARFGDQASLRASFRRLTTSKTWDRLLERWTQVCPELIDRLDMSPMRQRMPKPKVSCGAGDARVADGARHAGRGRRGGTGQGREAGGAGAATS